MVSGISLFFYAGGYVLADMDEQSLILMNYASEDLQDPTIVKNSYSQSITLQGTDINDRIFGHYFKNISSADGGFNPNKKIPFVIFAKTGELMEMGYAKLDEVVQNGKIHSYKVTLYGGIGEFLYNLMYDGEGNKMSLADLNYLFTDDPSGELDFTINRATILSAWDNLSQTTPSAPYGVINFAPCNNGLPEDFDANKAYYASPALYGIPATTTVQDGTDMRTITPTEGVLATFEQEFTEWEMLELRSYLQRPILSVRSVIDAICASANNGGYTVNLDESFFNDENPYYAKTWMTLKSLTEIDMTANDAQDGSAISSVTGMSSSSSYNKNTTIWSAEEATGQMQGILEMSPRVVSDITQAIELVYPPSEGSYNKNATLLAFCFFGYDENDNKIYATAPSILESSRFNGSSLFTEVSDSTVKNSFSGLSTLNPNAPVNRFRGSFEYDSASGRHQWKGDAISIGFSGWYNVAYINVEIVIAPKMSYAQEVYLPGGTSPIGYKAISCNVRDFHADITYTMDKMVERVTTGVRFTKAELLGDTMSPAEFLLSYIKMFNLKMFCNNKEKVIDIVTDENYLNGVYLDLDGRVDETEKTTIPLGGDVARINLSAEIEESAAAQRYQKKYGRVFGSFLIHTGYQFNDEQRELMDKVAFKGGINANDKGDFYDISPGVLGGMLSPIATLAEAKVLYRNDSTGDNQEVDVEARKTTISPMYSDNPGYFPLPLPEFCDQDRKGLDGATSLLFYGGKVSLPSIGSIVQYINVTDDVARALELNEGIPCWQPIARNSLNGIKYIPLFSRQLGGSYVNYSLDYGLPKEFYDLQVRGYSESAPIYPKYWQNFIAAQYDKDTRRLKVKVDLRGIDVGQMILRRPCFYDGSWWYISEISNHALAKQELTEMTLVKMVGYQYNQQIEEE